MRNRNLIPQSYLELMVCKVRLVGQLGLMAIWCVKYGENPRKASISLGCV